MSEEPPLYLAYMLRVWQAGRTGSLSWRVSLESPHTGERHTFTSLEALCAFLHERTGQDAAAADGDGRAGAAGTGGQPRDPLPRAPGLVSPWFRARSQSAKCRRRRQRRLITCPTATHYQLSQ